jgi:hypothetical protein
MYTILTQNLLRLFWGFFWVGHGCLGLHKPNCFLGFGVRHQQCFFYWLKKGQISLFTEVPD